MKTPARQRALLARLPLSALRPPYRLRPLCNLRPLFVLLLIALLPLPRKAYAEAVGIHPGCVELGVAGALTRVEGSTQAQILLRSGPFVAAGPGLAGLQCELGTTHERDLDRFEVQGIVSWQRRVWRPELWPYLGVAGGVQIEWLGSFRTTRFPVGADAGVRTLLGNRAGLRLEYRYRRLLDDPVADYDEHRLVLGVSLFLHNRPPY